jgi:formylglycine-generating enzyme required for sulfatase activity
MANQTIYTVGGTVQAGGGIYIPRKADAELLALCRAGEFAFILSSRQVGKSSLMVRTAQQLEKEGIRSVIIDLSSIGVKILANEWYLGILNEIANTLELKTNFFEWWDERAGLSPATRLTNFFRDVLLKEVTEPVVLFFDEIDSTLSIPFADDFFAALRAIYNARSTVEDFKRLSVVMIGVATPSDLISDSARTPFNIGRRVEINDFSPIESLPLAQSFGQQATQVLTWVFQYTGGHPYLTQRLCAYLAGLNTALDEETVAKTVEHLFTGEEGKQDNNLQFVRDMLSKRSPNVARVLSTYKRIKSGKVVMDDERSITKSHLKLSGLVRSDQGILRIRNEIYNSVFNLRWIQENTPKNWQKTALISLGATLAILVLSTLGIFVYDYMVASRIDNYFKNFISATSPTQRLSSLAGIYGQKGLLSNRDSGVTASELFYRLSSAEEQLALFTAPEISDSIDLQNDMVVVIGNLYSTLANVNPRADNTRLLETMCNALEKIPGNPTAVKLHDEITAWLDGRMKAADNDLDGALKDYTAALTYNPSNHAVLYERAKVLIAKGSYELALLDLDSSIGYAKQTVPDIEVSPTPTTNPTIAITLTSSPTQKVVNQTLSLTVTPLGNEPSPDAIGTSVSGIAPTSTPPLQLGLSTFPVRKFESNFTTLIDVITAIQALIESNSELGATLEVNAVSYTNLQMFGLTSITSPLQLSVLGPSVSFYQDDAETPQGIDFEKMKKSASFVIIRAGQNTWVDADFKTNWGAAKQVGLPRGSYWFYDSRTNPSAQAELWVQQLGGDFGELPLFVDFEESYGGSYKGWENWRIFLENLKSLVPGKEIAIYTAYYYWRDNAPNATTEAADLEYFRQYPLWIPHYGVTEPMIPKPWSKNEWLFWQYTETGDGELYGVESKGIDLNYFNGTEVDFQQFLINSADVSPAAPVLNVDSPMFSEKSGMTFVYIPAGRFIMGNDKGESDQSPAREVDLDAFWIGQTEVTNKQYKICVDANVCEQPASSRSNTQVSYYGNPEFDNYPVLFVNWEKARKFCQWSEGNLPSEAQWEKAARGPEGFIYPWGDVFNRTALNFCDTNCVAEKFNSDVVPVKSYPLGQSGYGAFDMAGNVWEWVDDWYDAYDGNQSNSIDFGQKYRVMRGGSWFNSDMNYMLTTYRGKGDPIVEGNFLGFRCAISP